MWFVYLQVNRSSLGDLMTNTQLGSLTITGLKANFFFFGFNFGFILQFLNTVIYFFGFDFKILVSIGT